ncbi:TetR/AcrR family transcriptional regulator [Paenibacillus lautus]|uniref:TetR/AcrR family transcriptional regulator n=1 Tax=Paenibacillus lautus TaxID=1401 RepID=A0A385TG25_PAELA|nr:TetR/AcrR family transcriptional regulator [Paenibacillus lautus]AYB42381.1 TetR/AcrR family transcriptional regulator [Paenibacillus lautus]MBY0160919.1 TetR/AcrR family transcriptional regulator [Cytobacillus firmus]
MAPKTKFTKQDIVLAAFDIAKTDGIESITIRKVAERLGSSIAPIYVNFNDVQDLLQQVVERALQVARGMIMEQQSGQPFRDIGMASLRFAKEYPVLYRDLMMKDNPHMKNTPEQLAEVIGLMRHDPELAEFSDQELQSILLNMQVFQTGLCVMVANDLFTKNVDDEQMMNMMDEAAEAFMRAAHARKLERD